MSSVLESIVFWHWWVLGAVLITIEMLAPTTFLLWPGIAAGVVGLVVLIFPGVGWEVSVFLFAVLSVGSAVAGRYYIKKFPAKSTGAPLNRRGAQYIGSQFTLADPIVGGRGKLSIDDTIWTIEGPDLNSGARVKIVEVDGSMLKVEQE